ncbi:MAG TPA: hypothetical protein PK156_28155 [Polyangium sp.]|nr:hypothetical protein [Polyangium sp.]
MNLGDSAVVLRPRSIAEIADLAFRVCFSRAFPLYLRLMFFSIVPAYAICLALYYWAELPWVQVWLVAILIMPFVEATFSIAVSQLMFSPAIRPKAVFALLWKRFGSLIWSLVIRGVGVLIAVMSIFILTPFVLIRLLLLDEACLLEGLSGYRAYQRTHRLVESRGAGAGLLFVMLIGAIRVGSVILAELTCDGIINELLQFGRPMGLFRDGGSPESLAGFFLAIPIIATARFLYYIDTRTRADGWDIQLRFHGIRARAEAERKAA